MLRVRVTTRGPMFDGRAVAAAHDYLDRVEEAVAKEGERALKRRMHRVFKNPTGYYESKVHVQRNVITDSGVVYGPWLAGTGSRNYPVTRFRGYDHWRVAEATMEQRKIPTGERVLRRFLRRMN